MADRGMQGCVPPLAKVYRTLISALLSIQGLNLTFNKHHHLIVGRRTPFELRGRSTYLVTQIWKRGVACANTKSPSQSVTLTLSSGRRAAEPRRFGLRHHWKTPRTLKTMFDLNRLRPRIRALLFSCCKTHTLIWSIINDRHYFVGRATAYLSWGGE
jgi:hypothetical protein